MAKNPKIKLTMTPTDRIVESLGLILLIGIWVFVLVQYGDLPDRIPTHFNAAGQADGFGSKSMIILEAIIPTVLFVGLTTVNKLPHLFNYPTPITAENAERQYSMAARMMRWLKLVIMIIFGMIIISTVNYSGDSSSELGTWFLPVTLLMTFLPIGYFVLQASKSKK